ncbi:RNA polymerase sigma factor RpoD/SigA [Brachyspira pilosicoli]|uniref:DNA directed RNA polymerase sigma subunit n=3 Tax=Brachyspira pilosicoli TaxID=52584 RepID=D8IBW9_BRAP9|nr:RNA polymerase sigma factor RpoD/SigA [Brachyspira pilosicoli]ADK30642.1 DNA directed RNA polymerase sigma subunit [Brachyspira pilosicoli 95/1000]AGA67531.1 DNA directed RNA polymerase sigma subunit [Brachyspira pilosicoli P43/6/78]MBW5378056.1 RNA polymerase sigma factor RpoD/SigA [Brachyspira pilosicoli]MBW5382997.1 RNA polymerase sigma factor RpoD/SigA [Brachyspira pilosicoli]MBW5391954.1 RNA polymerase sigma factor RpoD/SigA [Brachyspira pilosicoli]
MPNSRTKSNIEENNNISLYFADAKREKLLTREEEIELTQRLKKGDSQARAKLIRSNLRFVISIAKQYKNSGLLLEDLIGEGNLGLIIATDRFDPDKGYHFISYAVYWIRQSILRAINEKSRLIRLPLNKAMDLVDLERAVHQCYYKTGHMPDVEDLAAILKKEPREIRNIMSMNNEYVSLEKDFNMDGVKDRLADVVEDKNSKTVEDILSDKELTEELKIAMEELSDIEKEIINARYGLDQEKKTLKEVGEKYSFTKERIRQIEKKALKKMHSKRYSSLKDFLN